MKPIESIRSEIFRISLFLVLLSGFISPVGIDASEVARIGACDYPPYEFAYPEDDKRGFDVEVAEAAFQRVGIDTVFEFYPWARAIQMAMDGELTAVLSCVDKPKRREFFIMSDPISVSTRVSIVRKEYDGPPLNSLMVSLKGLILTAQPVLD